MRSSFTASHLILAAVALFVGLALGGLMPRGEVRVLRAQVAELEARDCSGGAASEDVGQQIVRALGRGGDWAPRRRTSGRPSEVQAAPEPVVDPPAVPEATVPAGDGPPPAGGPAAERVEEVVAALEMRRAQARQALREQAALSDAQLDAVDAAVDDMNVELGALAQDFVAAMEAAGGEPDRRESMRFARDTIDVLVEAEDAIWGTLDDDQRERVDPAAIDPFSYVDGGVVETLSEVAPP